MHHPSVDGRRRGGRPKTSADAIIVRKRWCEWLDRRIQGHSFQEIADEFGVHKNAVFGAVTKLLAEMPVEDATNLRQVELARLDRQLKRLERAAVAAANQDELDSTVEAVLLKNHERRCKLLGLDLQVGKRDEQQALDVEELRKLLNACGFDVVPLIETKGETVDE